MEDRWFPKKITKSNVDFICVDIYFVGNRNDKCWNHYETSYVDLVDYGYYGAPFFVSKIKKYLVELGASIYKIIGAEIRIKYLIFIGLKE